MNGRRNPRRRRRAVPTGTAPEHFACCGTRPGVDTLSASELHQELVADGVAGHATDLARFVAACERIGRLTHRGAEDAFTAVTDEVACLRGRSGMPML